MITSDDDFDEYAIKNYQNPNCVSVLEFLEDLNKIKYIKRLINKYTDRGELRERLVLNHIIFLSNVFGVEATIHMLRFRVEQQNHSILNSFLILLNYVKRDEVPYDAKLLEELEKRV